MTTTISESQSQISSTEHVLSSSQTTTQNSISTYVKTLVDKTATNTSIENEKKKVQSLINGLVQRVQDNSLNDNSNTDSSSNPTNKPNNSKSTTSSSDSQLGVPSGDTRIWSITSSDITFVQSQYSITLFINVPAWVKKNNLSVQFSPGGISVDVRNPDGSSNLSIQRVLFNAVVPDGCMWVLEGSGETRKLSLEMDKARASWWNRLFMDDDPSMYHVVEKDVVSNTTVSVNKPEDKQVDKSTDEEQEQNKEVDLSSTNASDSTTTNESKNSAQDMNNIVKGVIEDIIEKVTKQENSTKEVDITPSNKERNAPVRTQRVLTRADIPKIIEQYRTTIEKRGPGASDAALQLATFYHHGIGTEKDDMEAARLYKFALENGSVDPSAAFQLGLIYNQGATGMEPNPQEAVQWWKVSANLGNPVAMFNLGVMYMNGSGCDMDPVIATSWFEKAQALNPQLQPPRFSRAQLEERIAIAAKLKKQKMKQMMSPEEKALRKQLAMKKIRLVGYSTAALIGVTASVIAIRYWWRNRL